MGLLNNTPPELFAHITLKQGWEKMVKGADAH